MELQTAVASALSRPIESTAEKTLPQSWVLPIMTPIKPSSSGDLDHLAAWMADDKQTSVPAGKPAEPWREVVDLSHDQRLPGSSPLTPPVLADGAGRPAIAWSDADFSLFRPTAVLHTGDDPAMSVGHLEPLTVTPADDGGKFADAGPVILQALIPPPTQDGVVTGTADDDVLENSATNNTFQGLAGDDVYRFVDNWGNDLVEEDAGNGDDTLDFSAVTRDLTFNINADGTIDVTDGINTLTATANVENLIGGQGSDTFVFADGAALVGSLAAGRGEDTLDFSADTAGIVVDLDAGTSTGTASVAAIENVRGGSGGDTITGDGGDNLIVGGAGDDTLVGGAGNDTVSYALATAGVTVDLGNGAAQDTLGHGIDTLTGFENVIGTAFDDTLSGDAGDNLIAGGAGDDSLAGGAGRDTVSFATAAGPVTVDLSVVASQTATGQGIDTLSDFEDIIGSGFGSGTGGGDSLTGSVADNRFFVAAGNNSVIDGLAGSDTLVVDGAGLALQVSAPPTPGVLAFDTSPPTGTTTVTHTNVESTVVQNASADLVSEDVEQLSLGLQALADRLEELESIGSYASAIPLADPLGATFGDLQNFGRVLQELVNGFNATYRTTNPDGSFAYLQTTSADVEQFLTSWSDNLQAGVAGTAEDIRGTLEWVARTLNASQQIVVDSNGEIAEIRFLQQLASDRTSEMDLNLSSTLRDASVTVARETLFDFVSGFELDMSFGITGLAAGAPEFFIDETLDLASAAALPDGVSIDVVADALIGFMEGSVNGQLSEINAAADAVLGASGGSWTLTELVDPGEDPFAIASSASSILANLPFDTAAGFAAGAEDIGDGLIDLPNSDFLAAPLQVVLPGESGDFTLITPNELLRMLDQLGGWLTGLAQSEILDLNIPFAGATTIGDLLDFGEAFGDELLRFLMVHDGLRLSQDLIDNGGQLPGGGVVVFSVDVESAVGTETYDIEFDTALTAGNAGVEQLRQQIETALVARINDTAISDEIEVFFEAERIGFRPIATATNVTGVALPMVGNESLGFDGGRFAVPTAVLDTGVLGHDLVFVVNAGDETQGVNVPAITVQRDATNTSVDDLITDINAALAVQFTGVTVAFDAGSTRELAFVVEDDAILNSDGRSIGTVSLVDVRAPASLVDGLLNLGVEAAGFSSAQDLADRLSDILSGIVGGVSVNFDVANSEMSFTVDLARTFDIAALPIDVSVDLGEFIDLDSTADLGVAADVALAFTFGVDLAPSESLIVAPPVAVPDLPSDGQLLNDASFDIVLLQQNFDAADRLSGGSLNVSDWSVTANAAAQSATWLAPASGQLADAEDNRIPDHHFFIAVTNPAGDVTYVDGILLSIDTQDNTSIAKNPSMTGLADDLEQAMIDALDAAGFAGLQIAIDNATETGFDVSASGAGFDGFELRLVTEDEFAVATIDDVTLSVDDTNGNTSIGDLVEDLQGVIDNATQAANLEQVDDTLLGLAGPQPLAAGAAALLGEIPVPENGVLDRDVRFEITIGGTTYRGVVTADSTIDNEQESDDELDPVAALAEDVQTAIADAIGGATTVFGCAASAAWPDIG